MHAARSPRLLLSFASAVVLLSIGCSGDGDEPQLEELPFEPASPDEAPDPSVMGPFPVGVRTIELEDASRDGINGTDARKLVVEIWYPAAQSSVGEPTVTYDLWEELPEDIQAQIPRDALGVLDTPAVRDADVQPDRGPFPLIVFSHGKGGIRMQSTYYTVVLASHGYVVVSPDHQGDTIAELVREGDVEIASTTDAYFDRPLDVHFLIDHFVELDEADPLFGHVDTDTVGMTGHSFGALTSFRAAGENARIRAVVAQTPVGVGLVNAGLEVQVADFTIPTQIQAAGQDETLELELHADSLWEHMPAPAYYLTLATGGHFTYSDLCIFDIEAIDEALPDLNARKVLEDGCGADQVQPEVAFPTINHFAVGHFNAYLRGSDETRAMLTEAEGQRLAPGEATLKTKL